jgi:hypothetical protein
MSYPINYPTPQGANVQMFYRNSDWVKPQGASFVWFTLIGAGGTGDSNNGGGSGAVTNFMGPAFLIPDVLRVRAGSNNQVTDTEVQYQAKDGSGYTLLQAQTALGQTAGSASVSNYFSCMGFFQSIAGQSGAGGSVPPSATTFLCGGGNGSGVVGNYGYNTAIQGFFQTQPIISGVGGNGTGRGGRGCGGGSTNPGSGNGGDGLVVIITW